MKSSGAVKKAWRSAVGDGGDDGGADEQCARPRSTNRGAAWRLPGPRRSELLVLPDDPHPPEPVPPTPLPPTPQNPQGVPPAIDDPRGPVDPAPVREPPKHSPPAIAAR